MINRNRLWNLSSCSNIKLNGSGSTDTALTVTMRQNGRPKNATGAGKNSKISSVSYFSFALHYPIAIKIVTKLTLRPCRSGSLKGIACTLLPTRSSTFAVRTFRWPDQADDSECEYLMTISSNHSMCIYVK